MRRIVLVCLLAIVISLTSSCRSIDGHEIFIREGCVVCHYKRSPVHGLVGHGTVDLTGIAGRRSDVWLREHIQYPKVHDSDIGMPGFAHLSAREITALIDFLKDERNKM
jgi:cbb3-type cytochrome oxidase cytochrome c subunit